MRIVINELKKLFDVKSILILMLLTCIMYKHYIIPSLSVREGSSFINNIYIGLIKNYGRSMDTNEYSDFLKLYDKKVESANDFINNNNEFKNLEIYDYEEYDRIVRNSGEKKYSNTKLQEFYYEYLYNEDITIFRELNEMENIKITYEGYLFDKFEESKEDKKEIIDRHKEILEGEEIQSLLPYTVFEDYEIQFYNLAKLILISVMFIISPIVLDDKVNKVNYLQYSSKNGRKIFKSKISATLIATFLITTVQLNLFFVATYFTTYFNDINKVFLDCGISGFYNTPIKSWFNLTFGQYILITCFLVYILSMIIGLVSMYISSKVDRYISLIGIQIPVLFVVSRFFMKFIINNATCMYIPIRGFYRFLRMPKYFLPVVYTILIIVVAFVLYKKYKNEKSISIN
ncbi:MAG: hypothetical protein ACRCXA_10105 [Peptostreptococcaceae bacterium]